MKHPNFKRMLTAFVVGLLLVCSISASALTANQIGDVDNNQKITASDARKVLRHSAKLELLADDVLDRADVNFDEKINASDARMILRVSAKLDTFDTSKLENTEVESVTDVLDVIEPTTEEPTTEEPTTEEPTTEEPTTEEPTTEEPTTEEPTTEEPSTEIVYPAAIDGLFEKHFYVEMADGDDTVGVARNGDDIEFNVDLGGVAMSIYASGDTVYMKYESAPVFITTKWYYAITSEDMAEYGFDFDIDEMLAFYDFGSKEDFVDITSYTEEVDGTEYTVYAFINEDGASCCFYADADDNIKMYCTKDAEGNSNNDEVYFEVLSYDIPSGMCSISGRVNDLTMAGLVAFMNESGLLDSLS